MVSPLLQNARLSHKPNTFVVAIWPSSGLFGLFAALGARRARGSAKVPSAGATWSATLLPGPGYVNLDMSIVKILRFGSRRAEFRADFFNALNRAHYANPTGRSGTRTSAGSREFWI
jgi:hypothetical protein